MAIGKVKSRVAYFLFGAVALLSQVILIRRLLSVFYGNELTIGALFAGWMFWFGVGGLASGPRSDRSKNPGQSFSYLLFLCAIVFALSAALVWLSRYIFGFSPGVMAGFGDTLLAGFLFSAPTCIVLGAAFNYAAKAFEADETNLVSLYIYEALGSAAAGIVSLLMSGRVSALNQILVCALLSGIAGAILLEHKMERATAASLIVIFFGMIYFFSGHMESSLVRWQWSGQEVVAEKESKYSTITITQREGQTTFWLDGFPAFSSPNREFFEEVVHLPLSMCENPSRILLIGGGLVPAAQEILKYPVKELVYVQIDPELTSLEGKYLPGFDSITKDSRVRIIHRDARIYMRRNAEPFDAIIVNLPSPETANLNRYYTREFFKLARENLKASGVLGFSVGSSGNYLSDAQAELLANAIITLQTAFRQVAVLPLDTNFLVASQTSDWITENPDQIVSRLKERNISTKFVREYYLKDNLAAERISSVKARLKPLMSQPVNKDLKPRGYYLSSLLWLEQASPEERGAIKRALSISQKPLYLSLAAFLLISAGMVAWKGRRAFSNVSIFAIGFAGIGAELILILAFQVGYGYVYYLVGALVSAFMVGLAIGAYFYQRLKTRIEKHALASFTWVMSLEALALLIAVPGVSAAVKWNSGPAFTLALIFSLLILVAIFSGMAFPLCVHIYRSVNGAGIGATAGWINASDHFGSCLGAFTVAAFLVPLFGLQFGLIFSLALVVAALASGLALSRSV